MTITNDEVNQIAHLARIKIADEYLADSAEKLSNILDLANDLNKVNTDNILPMSHPLNMNQRLRKDKVTKSDKHKVFQKIAPKVANKMYLVPKVIE